MDSSLMAKNVFDHHAEEYQRRFMNVAQYAQSLDVFCENLGGPKPAVLDVACGPGNLSRYVLEKLPNTKLSGFDIAPGMVKLALANNPSANFYEMDCRQLNSIKTSFQGILCGFVLPYLNDYEAGQLISNCAGLLVDEGVLLLSTIENETTCSGLQTSSSGEKLLMYFRPASNILEMLAKNSLSIINKERIPCNNAQHDTDLVIVAKKQTSSPESTL